MAALALGSALEAMMYAYFIIWSGDDGNDPSRDAKIPDDLDWTPGLRQPVKRQFAVRCRSIVGRG